MSDWYVCVDNKQMKTISKCSFVEQTLEIDLAISDIGEILLDEKQFQNAC